MNFQKGDKVRMLRSSESGIVLRVSGNIIEIETTDGFTIPVVASDLAKVSSQEAKFFNKEVDTKSDPEIAFTHFETRIGREAFSLAFEPLNDQQMKAYIINHNTVGFHFVLSVKKEGRYINLTNGKCDKLSEEHLPIDLKMKDFDTWSKWRVQMLFFKEGEESRDPFQQDIQLKGAKLFKEKQTFGSAQKSGYVLEVNLSKPEAEKKEDNTNQFFEPYLFDKQKTIDLHAAALGIKETDNALILEEQFKVFLTEFDHGVANDLSEMTVIHGVGNGVLRTKIHKHIATSDNVEWFKDAQKEKFGYGATLIHFKP